MKAEAAESAEVVFVFVRIAAPRSERLEEQQVRRPGPQALERAPGRH